MPAYATTFEILRKAAWADVRGDAEETYGCNVRLTETIEEGDLRRMQSPMKLIPVGYGMEEFKNRRDAYAAENRARPDSKSNTVGHTGCTDAIEVEGRL